MYYICTVKDKIKLLKYIRRGEEYNYMYSLFKNSYEYKLKTKNIVYIYNDNIIFAIDNKNRRIHFSYKYFWIQFNINKWKWSINKKRKDIFYDFISFFLPQYSDYYIVYHDGTATLQQFIAENKLNKLYFELYGYNKMIFYYVIDDCKVDFPGFYSGRKYNKGELIYSNGYNYYKINPKTKISDCMYIPILHKPNENIKLLDLCNKDDMKLFNKYKSHILIDKDNCNYFFK